MAIRDESFWWFYFFAKVVKKSAYTFFNLRLYTLNTYKTKCFQQYLTKHVHTKGKLNDLYIVDLY